MNNEQQLEVALGKPLRNTLGGQEFDFYPLGIEWFPKVLKMISKFDKVAENDMFEVMGNEDNSSLMVELVREMVAQSFSEGTDKRKINQFCTKFFMELFEIFIELNSPTGADVSDGKIQRMKEYQKQLLDAKKEKEGVKKDGSGSGTAEGKSPE